MDAQSESKTPLTQERIASAQTHFSFDTLAELLRQHAQVDVRYQGQSAGYDLKQELPRLEERTYLSDEENELRNVARVWVGKANPFTHEQVDVDAPEDLTSSLGLAHITKALRAQTRAYAKEDVTGRRGKLHELQKGRPDDPSSFAYKTLAALVKTEELEKLDIMPEHESISASLSAMRRFLETEVVPASGISGVKARQIKEKIRQSLHEPLGDRPSYIARAAKLFTHEPDEMRAKRSFRARHLYDVIVSRDATEALPVQLEEELLKTAAAMNHLRMMEVMEGYGIDFVKSRKTVEKLLAEYPKDRPSATRPLTVEYYEWFAKMVDVIAPITNTLRTQFPHDTAYALGQMLETHQATCAGKAYVITHMLRAIGLDAVVATNKFFGNPYESGQHVMTAVKLGHGVYLTVDANMKKQVEANVFQPLEHNMTINIPTGIRLLKGQKAIESALNHETRTYVATSNGFVEYRVIGDGYQVIEFAQGNPEIDYLNFGADLEGARAYGETLDNIDLASILYASQKELAIFPFDAETRMSLVEYLLLYHKEFAEEGLIDSDPKEVLRYAVGLIYEGLSANPFYVPMHYQLGQLFLEPDFPADGMTDQDRALQADARFTYVYQHFVGEIDQTEFRLRWIALLRQAGEYLLPKYGTQKIIDAQIKLLEQADIKPQRAGRVIRIDDDED